MHDHDLASYRTYFRIRKSFFWQLFVSLFFDHLFLFVPFYGVCCSNALAGQRQISTQVHMDNIGQFITVGFAVVFWGTIVLALVARLRRVLFQRKLEFNQIYPLANEANRLIFRIDSSACASVWTTSKKKIYKITKAGNRWHIQNCNSSVNNKKILSTIKNSFREKFIVLNLNNPNIRDSPLGTTPSLLKYDSSFFTSLQDLVLGSMIRSDYTFGTAVVLRWVGLNHFEIITKENRIFGKQEAPVDIHKRVAYVNEFDENNETGYNIWFDYNQINTEILISTFLFSLLNQKSKCRGLLKPKSSKTSSIV